MNGLLGTAAQEERRLRKKKIVSAVILLAFALLIVGAGFWLSGPILKLIRNRGAFRAFLERSGPGKYLLMTGLMALQVVVAVIPGGPIEVAAGYAFGPWLGTVLCVLGGLLASVLIFLFVRAFGLKYVYALVPRKQLEAFSLVRDRRRLHLLMAVIFLIPGLPKDVLTYLAGITPISLGAFLLISTAARTPSIFISAMGGHRISEGKYLVGAVILAALLVVTLAASLVYRRHAKRASGAAGPDPEGTDAPGPPDAEGEPD